MTCTEKNVRLYNFILLHIIVNIREEKKKIKKDSSGNLYGFNMNIGNGYRQARSALYFEKPHFAVTAQLDNIKAKNCPKKIRPKLCR